MVRASTTDPGGAAMDEGFLDRQRRRIEALEAAYDSRRW
jgi:hypothetical protein